MSLTAYFALADAVSFITVMASLFDDLGAVLEKMLIEYLGCIWIGIIIWSVQRLA
jgi:hypothetical protein